jgi:hypothetical protein
MREVSELEAGLESGLEAGAKTAQGNRQRVGQRRFRFECVDRGASF